MSVILSDSWKENGFGNENVWMFDRERLERLVKQYDQSNLNLTGDFIWPSSVLFDYLYSKGNIF